MDMKNCKVCIDIVNKKCLQIGMTSKNIIGTKRLYRKEFEKRLNENSNLIYLALNHDNVLLNEDSVMMIVDKEGCVLHIFNKAYENLLIMPGIFLSYDEAGTNAVSVCIESEAPVEILGEEHYIEYFYDFASYASPIKNSDGELVGILAMIMKYEKSNSYVLPMLIAISNFLEEKMNSEKAEYNAIEDIFSYMPVGVITLDVSGNIRKLNKTAVDMLGYEKNEIMSINIKNIFENWEEIQKQIYINNTVNQEIIIKGLYKKIRCNAVVKTIYNTHDNVIEIILVIYEKINKKEEILHEALYTFENIVGKDEDFVRIIQYAKKISDNKSPVLIKGEEGVGKKTIAQAMHNYSFRMDEPFIIVKCGWIPKDFMNIYLFGYEDDKNNNELKIGKLEAAGSGTIFFDEITELPLDVQAQLINCIENGYIYKGGGYKKVSINARIICSSSKNLEQEIVDGNLRKDLYYAIKKFEIYLPRLLQRKNDIPILVNYFLRSISKKLSKKIINLPEEYIDKMLNYNWPGNVEELKNIVEVIVSTGIIPDEYLKKIKGYNEKTLVIDVSTLKLDYVEKQHISKVLKIYNGNITYTASALGIGRNTLYGKLKKYNM